MGLFIVELWKFKVALPPITVETVGKGVKMERAVSMGAPRRLWGKKVSGSQVMLKRSRKSCIVMGGFSLYGLKVISKCSIVRLA